MLHRFFVESERLAPDQCRQIATVLRLAPGAVVTLVLDGEELEYRLERVSAVEIAGTVIARRPAANEPRAAVTLALPLLRRHGRDEEVIEAVTQLGIARIAPFTSERSVARELSAAKRERWVRIAREAAETARRGRVPIIEEVRDWPALLAALPIPILVAWEGEHERALEDALALLGSTLSLSLVVGPEGGLTDLEVALARGAGALTLTLGPRNLRSETAAVAAVALAIASYDRPAG